MNQDTFNDKLGNARKAVAAGLTAALSAATPLIIGAVQLGSDGGASLTGGEVGTIVGGFFAAFASVGYVTWNTVNKPKPSDIAQLDAAVAQAAAVAAPIQVVSMTPAQDLVDGAVGVFPADEDETPVAEGYAPKHTAE